MDPILFLPSLGRKLSKPALTVVIVVGRPPLIMCNRSHIYAQYPIVLHQALVWKLEANVAADLTVMYLSIARDVGSDRVKAMCVNL